MDGPANQVRKIGSIMFDNLSLWTISLAVIVAWIIFRTFLKGLEWKKAPPGPWGVPVLGYLPWLDKDRPHLSFDKLAKKYGPIYSIQMGQLPSVAISDPKMIKQAFSMSAIAGRADLYLAHGIFDGRGIISTHGAKWKEMRKFVFSCLKEQGMAKSHPNRERLGDLILHWVEDTILKITSDESSAKTGVVFKPILVDSIGNIMNNIILGRTYAIDDPEWKFIKTATQEGVEVMGDASVINFLPFLRVIPKYARAMKFIVGGMLKTYVIFRQIIAEHKGLEEDVIGCFMREQEVKNREGPEHYFTDEELLYLMGDLFGAGVDTTLSTLRWLFLIMAVDKSIQEKIQMELETVLGNKRPNLDDWARLPYLEATICECQRVRTAVSLGVPHGVLTDCTLGPYTLRKGTMVLPLLWSIHMDPNIWPEPDKIKPERFLDEFGNFRKPEAFMPYLIGKRACPGEELARMMLFLYASVILQRFTVELPEDEVPEGQDPLEGESDLFYLPKYGRLIFKPRLVV